VQKTGHKTVSQQPSSKRIGGKGNYHDGADITGTPEDNDLGSDDGEYEEFALPVYMNAHATPAPMPPPQLSSPCQNIALANPHVHKHSVETWGVHSIEIAEAVNFPCKSFWTPKFPMPWGPFNKRRFCSLSTVNAGPQSLARTPWHYKRVYPCIHRAQTAVWGHLEVPKAEMPCSTTI
jgi:hypothetical protein